eukprot:scaffold273147_cov30-Tisochrysis_lutea.AAC.3
MTPGQGDSSGETRIVEQQSVGLVIGLVRCVCTLLSRLSLRASRPYRDQRSRSLQEAMMLAEWAF